MFPPGLCADIEEFLSTLLVALGQFSWDKKTNQQFVLTRVSIHGELHFLITFTVSANLGDY